MFRLIASCRGCLNIALAVYNRIRLPLTASLNHYIIQHFI